MLRLSGDGKSVYSLLSYSSFWVAFRRQRPPVCPSAVSGVLPPPLMEQQSGAEKMHRNPAGLGFFCAKNERCLFEPILHNDTHIAESEQHITQTTELLTWWPAVMFVQQCSVQYPHHPGQARQSHASAQNGSIAHSATRVFVVQQYQPWVV